MRILARYQTGGPISAQAAAYRPGGGEPIIIAGSDALYAWRADDDSLLPSFPLYGRNFFASRPLVIPNEHTGLASSDKTPLVFAGNDDDRLYGFDFRGRSLPGFPLATGGDVYSSPVAADVDGDGFLELFVGSDDGNVYAWTLATGGNKQVQSLAGWPQGTGGFVSATPVLADVDGDGQPEIIAGSWDRQVYVWRADGSLLPGWPQTTGQSIWSAALVADVDGDGQQEILIASDQVYAWRSDGRPLAGWPQETTSTIVGTPVVADLTGDGQLEIIAAADRVYAWRRDSRSLPGFPLDLGTFFWASPVIGRVETGGNPRIYLTGWDGSLYVVNSRGLVNSIRLSSAPLFAAPLLVDLDNNGSQEIVAGSWDGNLYVIKDDQQAEPRVGRRLDSTLPLPEVLTAGSFSAVPEASAPFIAFPGPLSTRATMYYEASPKGNNQPGNRYKAAKEPGIHPVPLVVHQGRLTGLVQPFPAGSTVKYWLKNEGQEKLIPDVYHYNVVRDWPGRIRRRLQRRRVTR